MKIGLVLPYNIAKGGGVKEHVLAQQSELIRRGHDVVIVTPQPRDAFAGIEHPVRFLGTATDFKTPMHTTSQISASVMTDEIDGLLEYEQFDLIHFHEPWVPVLSRQILSRSKAVNVATFHAKLPETLVSRTMAKVITPYTKPLLKHIDAFTAVSDAAAEYLRTLSDEPITIIPNGINLKHFQRNLKTDIPSADLKTILYVGRLEGRKGVHHLLDAFALLQARQPDTELVLAGDGPDREKLELQVGELGLQNVRFLGFISEHEKIALLHASDLFCSPAVFGESFGIVLLEAMASHLVTVAGNNSGYASVMQGLGKLSLINPKEPEEFAHRLELLLYDEDLRNLWRKWAKDSIRQYDYRKVVDQYEAVYGQALETVSSLTV